MSTLIKNIGILDARQASAEQVREIGKIYNVGCLVVSPENKAEFSRISMTNVGKLFELDGGYKLHTGPMEITKQLLEDSEEGVKLCMVGPLDVASDISEELLQAKLVGLHMVGPASVPEKLYGIFMKKVKDIVGNVAIEPEGAVKARGKLTITNDYLRAMDDHSEFSVSGHVKLDKDVDPALFEQKIASLRVAGPINFHEGQEKMLKKVLKDTEKTRIKILRFDYHYVPGGTVIDSFTLMTLGNKTISCYGILFLHEEVTHELIQEKNVRFEAGTVYFPKSVMREMASRLGPETKGIPYEPEKTDVVACEQTITQARLEAMPDKNTLVVTGILNLDDDIKLDTLSAKIATLDNYGEIIASKDVASILQGKLRINDGSIQVRGEKDLDFDESGFDNVIENVATFTL
ncbi:MAG: hypothetical protein K0B87_07695 [Candidatus Syntrophosphaera sp.]|nr:hypothetical protein [Candidatus Syntrophosphaera sp.]